MGRLTASRIGSLTDLADHWNAVLMETPEALSYLAGREIENETLARHKIGYASETSGEYGMYHGRIALPVITLTGVTGFQFRCIQPHSCKEEGHSKYLTEGKSRLWGSEAIALADDTIGMTEGAFDALTAWQVLGLPTVGIPGVGWWKDHARIMKRLLSPFGTVLYFADPDEPGQKVADQIRSDLGNVVVPQLEHDVNETVRRGGPWELIDRVGL